MPIPLLKLHSAQRGKKKIMREGNETGAEHPKEKYKDVSHVSQLVFQAHSMQNLLTLQAHVAFPWHQAGPPFAHPPWDLTHFYGGCSGKGVNCSISETRPKVRLFCSKRSRWHPTAGAGRPRSQDQWIHP